MFVISSKTSFISFTTFLFYIFASFLSFSLSFFLSFSMHVQQSTHTHYLNHIILQNNCHANISICWSKEETKQKLVFNNIRFQFDLFLLNLVFVCCFFYCFLLLIMFVARTEKKMRYTSVDARK